MDETLKFILQISIPLAGIIISYFQTKKMLKSEIINLKIGKNLEKISELPMEILKLLDNMKDANNQSIEESALTLKRIMGEIFVYGSKDAVLLISNLQELNNAAAIGNINQSDKFQMTSYYILLLCQLKYDLTGTKINPEYWYKLKINDYNTSKEEIKTSNNYIVTKLGLKWFLRIH